MNKYQLKEIFDKSYNDYVEEGFNEDKQSFKLGIFFAIQVIKETITKESDLVTALTALDEWSRGVGE